MKKIKGNLIIPLLTIIIGTTMISTIHGNDIDGMEKEIQETIDMMLKTSNKKDMKDISKQDQEILVDKINEIKSHYIDIEAEIKNAQPRGRSATYKHMGRLFLTLDASTKGFPHGHAGIGHQDVGKVIEANPGDGVKVDSGRMNKYWERRKNGGVYAVRKESARHYKGAFSYANNREGKRYGFNSFDNHSFYCSELVFNAWKSQGYKLDHIRPWGALILPLDLMVDSDTYLVQKFKGR